MIWHLADRGWGAFILRGKDIQKHDGCVVTNKPPLDPLQKYLGGYPQATRDQVARMLEEQTLAGWLRRRYARPHDIRSDKQLYDYTMALKNEFLGKVGPLNRVHYDNRIQVIQHALGQHHFISRVHGGRLKAVNEIRIASVFRDSPEAFLKMIVVHELAHFREKEHNKAFYQMCCHMEPEYHQLEFELRVYLVCLEVEGAIYGG